MCQTRIYVEIRHPLYSDQASLQISGRVVFGARVELSSSQGSETSPSWRIGSGLCCGSGLSMRGVCAARVDTQSGFEVGVGWCAYRLWGGIGESCVVSGGTALCRL